MASQVRARGTSVSVRGILAAALALPPAYYATVLLLLAALAFRPVLLGGPLLLAIIQQAAPLGTVAIGQSLVMRCRSIDLSIGGIFVGADYIATSGLFAHWPGVAIIAACLVFGLIVGVINAILITFIRASAVIVTLGMSIVIVGVVVSFSYVAQPGEVPEVLRSIGSDTSMRFRFPHWSGSRLRYRRLSGCARPFSAGISVPSGPIRPQPRFRESPICE